MGLPRISDAAEAFLALYILPFRKLGIFNVLKSLFQLKGDYKKILYDKKYQKRKS